MAALKNKESLDGSFLFKNFFDKSLLLSSDYLLPTLPLQD